MDCRRAEAGEVGVGRLLLYYMIDSSVLGLASVLYKYKLYACMLLIPPLPMGNLADLSPDDLDLLFKVCAVPCCRLNAHCS